MARPSVPAIISPAYDLAWFVGPGLISIAVALWIGLGDPGPQDLTPAAWVATVVLVDVAHVWASLYRTYLDPVARRCQGRRLWVTPLLVGWLGFLLHLESPAAFWTILAYLAVFHFIMQHLGFLRIVSRKGYESRFDSKLATYTLWSATLGPILWWHAHLPREFAWFVADDFVTGLPIEFGWVALAIEMIFVATFVVRRLVLGRRGHANPLAVALVLVPAANWYLGMVAFNDDRIFTVTNVLLHGVPYLALVWHTGGRTRVRAGLARVRLAATPAATLAAYYGLLVVLALTEEGLWDRWLWHDHPEIFGAGSNAAGGHPVAVAALVALLTVPQATHYVLDRYIWRTGPSNPCLAAQLGLAPPGRSPP